MDSVRQRMGHGTGAGRGVVHQQMAKPERSTGHGGARSFGSAYPTSNSLHISKITDTGQLTDEAGIAKLLALSKRLDASSIKVCVLAGGWSDEREISRLSGTACANALRTAGFNVSVVDPAAPGFLASFPTSGFDVAFVAMHGRYGEDGCIQGYLELVGIPYTFSGVAAQAVAMEKDRAKRVFAAAGIPVAPGVTIPAGTRIGVSEASELVERLGVPLIVKPVANGSSYGVSKVNSATELPSAIAAASSTGQGVLVEHCIAGTEITVPVIGNADAVALPVIEIVTGAEFYDLTVKYEPGELHHVIPARLSPDVYTQAQELAVAAHLALGCAGCSRSDFIVDADGNPCLLETNTIPGMTDTSLLPDSARHAGIDFPQLCKLFVALALEAHPTRHN